MNRFLRRCSLRCHRGSPARALSAFVIATGALTGQLHGVGATTTLTPTTINMAWVFDNHIPPDQVAQLEAEQNVGYVWGASQAEPTGGTAVHDLYISWQQGYCPGDLFNLSCPSKSPPSYPWLSAHHPNWIFWRVDRKGKPTSIAHSKHDAGPIVNFTDPTVRAYWMNEFIRSYLQSGFSGVGWDHSIVYNSYRSAGHFTVKHTFLRQFVGKTEEQKYGDEETAALGQFLTMAKAVNPSVKFASNVNDLCAEPNASTWFEPLKYIGVIFDEAGYTNWGDLKNPWVTSAPFGRCKNRWLAKTKAYISLQKQGKWLILDNEIPMDLSQNETKTNPRIRAFMQWALANYLLVKATHTYFWFGSRQDFPDSDSYGYPLVMQPEELLNIGTPRTSLLSKQHVYMRRYSHGIAIVNPDPSRSFKVVFPAGTYKSLYGSAISGVWLKPHSGLVLQKI